VFFVVLYAPGGICTACPVGEFTSDMQPNTVPTCECPAGSFKQTRVLNPPYASRSYSSVLGNTSDLRDHFSASLLDDADNEMAWCVKQPDLSSGQWMEMDIGTPMYIVGIITQGRGILNHNQYVKEFRVEYRLGDTSGVGIILPGTFSMTDVLKKEHTFSVPIYARYIRIVVLDWNNYISLRAALIVKSCSTCFSNAVSLQGSTASSACECLAGAYKYTSAFSNRAIALVPGQGAYLSTLANRNQRLFAATAIFDSAAGPPGSKGAVKFDRVLSQYLDGGTYTFNVATNGGFTIVSVVKFSGAPANGDRIIDFGKGPDNDNVIIYRHGDDKMLLSIRNGNTQCWIFTDAVIVQESWLTVVATYESSSRKMKLRAGNVTVSGTCSFAVTDRVFSTTYVGRSNWAGDTYSKGSIAGLYVVDALLSEAEIADISGKMYRGEDTLQSCQSCYGDSTSLQGSLSTADCQCQAGAYNTASEADKRAISLVSGRAQFSTLANRDLVLYKPTAVFDSTAGPNFGSTEGPKFSWFLTTPGTYQAVRQFCVENMGELATIHSAQENEAVRNTCKAGGCYIGYIRDSGSSPWYWQSGEAVTYSNWRTGEGTSSSETKSIIVVDTGTWGDIGQGQYDYPGVCQRLSVCTNCNGAVTFDRSLSQYLDGGSHTFNIA